MRSRKEVFAKKIGVCWKGSGDKIGFKYPFIYRRYEKSVLGIKNRVYLFKHRVD